MINSGSELNWQGKEERFEIFVNQGKESFRSLMLIRNEGIFVQLADGYFEIEPGEIGKLIFKKPSFFKAGRVIVADSDGDPLCYTIDKEREEILVYDIKGQAKKHYNRIIEVLKENGFTVIEE